MGDGNIRLYDRHGEAPDLMGIFGVAVGHTLEILKLLAWENRTLEDGPHLVFG